MSEKAEEQFRRVEDTLRPKFTPGFIAYTILAVMTGVALVGLVKEHRDLVQARQQSQVAFCLQQNEQARRNRAGLVDAAQVLVDAAARTRAATGQPPSDVNVIHAYLDNARKSAALQHPLRDCTEKGIRAFNLAPPNPIAEVCKPDGKGFCREEGSGP